MEIGTIKVTTCWNTAGPLTHAGYPSTAEKLYVLGRKSCHGAAFLSEGQCWSTRPRTSGGSCWQCQGHYWASWLRSLIQAMWCWRRARQLQMSSWTVRSFKEEWGIISTHQFHAALLISFVQSWQLHEAISFERQRPQLHKILAKNHNMQFSKNVKTFMWFLVLNLSFGAQRTLAHPQSFLAWGYKDYITIPIVSVSICPSFERERGVSARGPHCHCKGIWRHNPAGAADGKK